MGIVLTPCLYLVSNNLEVFGQEYEVAKHAATYLNVMVFFLVPQWLPERIQLL